jgi:hypothetical protein
MDLMIIFWLIDGVWAPKNWSTPTPAGDNYMAPPPPSYSDVNGGFASTSVNESVKSVEFFLGEVWCIFDKESLHWFISSLGAFGIWLMILSDTGPWFFQGWKWVWA